MTSPAVLTLFSIACLWSSAGYSTDCQRCGRFIDRQGELRQEQAESVVLLGKNQLILRQLGKQQQSESPRALKVRSNVSRILAQLEQIKSESAHTLIEATEKGCHACLIRNPDTRNAGA